MQDTDAATIVHALIPARWGDTDAWAITGFEVERIIATSTPSTSTMPAATQCGRC